MTKCHYGLFVRNRDIKPLKLTGLEEGAYFLRGKLYQLVVVCPQPAVDGRGEAVPQVSPQQAVCQTHGHHQQMTSR